jgi:hypothetical protein
MKYQAIVIIRSRNGESIGSHMVERDTESECESALAHVERWAGFHEIVRLYAATKVAQ